MSIPPDSHNPEFIEYTTLTSDNPFNFIDAGWLNIHPVMGHPPYSIIAHQAVVELLPCGQYVTTFRFTVLPDRPTGPFVVK